MTMIRKCLAAGAMIAAVGCAAPAAAQFYPGYGYPGYAYPGYGHPGYGAGVIGSIVNSVTGGSYGGYGYQVPGGGRVAASQCTAAVQQRLGGYGYAYGGPRGRVLSIDSVEIRGNGGYMVRGLASAGGPGGTIPFTCRTDPRGLVTHVAFNSGSYGNGYSPNPYYEPEYNNPYSVYGYSRY